MSASMVDINFLDVGQGSSCFVQIFEDDGSGIDEMVGSLLFDLGSLNNKKTAGGATIDFVYDELMGMDGGPVIDLLVVSHKDADHVNLLIPLIKKFKKNELKIKQIYYSGKKKWYNGLFSSITAWCKNTPAVNGLLIAGCGFDKTSGTWTALWNGYNVWMYLVMANTPSYIGEKRGDDENSIVDNPNGERVNTMSAVCSIYFNGRSYIVAGDATFGTIGEVNNALKGQNLGYVQAMTLPHHGSRKTTFGLSKTDADISKSQLKVVKTFAGIFNGKTLIASADTKHSHPSLEVMELFYEYTDKTTIWYTDPDVKAAYGKNWHYVTAYIDLDITYPDGSAIPMSSPPYESFPSSMNIYSTLYCYDKALFSFPPAGKLPKEKAKKAFPVGVSWYYRDDLSTLRLQKFDNRDALTLNAKEKRNVNAAEEETEEATDIAVTSAAETRRISAPAASIGVSLFSRRFGRRIV